MKIAYHLVRNTSELVALGPNALVDLNNLSQRLGKNTRAVTIESLQFFYGVGSVTVCACDGEKIVGAADVSYAPKRNGRMLPVISHVAVLSDYEGQGIATKIIAMLVEEVGKNKNAQPIFLQHSPSCRRFYLKLGFKPDPEAMRFFT